MKKTNIALIGAGPIGIEIATKLKANNIDYMHFEAGCIGATINWYAPNTNFFSSPERIAISGVPIPSHSQRKTTKEEYLAYLRSVVRQFNLKINTYTKVFDIKKRDEDFIISYGKCDSKFEKEVLSNKKLGKLNKVIASKVILAIGDMHSPKLLEIKGENLSHVSHYLEDPHKYYGQKVLIVGGRNSAIEAAIRLYRAGANVTLSYRKNELNDKSIKYWLYPEFKYLVKKKQITFLPKTEIKEIKSESVIFKNKKSLELEIDRVLLLTGYKQNKKFFNNLHIKLNGLNEKPSYSRKTMETNIKNVFVAGTATAGTQSSGVKEFIETSHVHVDRIIAKLKHEPAPKTIYNEILKDREN